VDVNPPSVRADGKESHANSTISTQTGHPHADADAATAGVLTDAHSILSSETADPHARSIPSAASVLTDA